MLLSYNIYFIFKTADSHSLKRRFFPSATKKHHRGARDCKRIANNKKNKDRCCCCCIINVFLFNSTQIHSAILANSLSENKVYANRLQFSLW